MTLPNKLTLARIIAVPAMVTVACIPYLSDNTIFAFDGGYLTYANFINFIIFILASVTDFLDGYIARKYNLVTTFGKFADPLADKMLVLTSFLAIILIRELMVSGIRLVAAQKGEVIAAGWAGKVKTFVTMIALIFVFLATLHVAVAIIALVLVYISVFLTVYSGVVYFINAKDMLLESV